MQRPGPAPRMHESTARKVPSSFKGSFETPRDPSFQGFLFFGSLKHSAYHASQVEQGGPLPKTGHGGKTLATAFSLWLQTCHTYQALGGVSRAPASPESYFVSFFL